MAKFNNGGQEGSPNFVSDKNKNKNIAVKSNKKSELDLIDIDVKTAKKDIDTVIDYANKQTKKSINNTKQMYKDLFTQINKSMTKTLKDLNSLESSSNTILKNSANVSKNFSSSSTNTMATAKSSGSFSSSIFNGAIFNNSTFSNATFSNVTINGSMNGSGSQSPSSNSGNKNVNYSMSPGGVLVPPGTLASKSSGESPSATVLKSSGATLEDTTSKKTKLDITDDYSNYRNDENFKTGLDKLDAIITFVEKIVNIIGKYEKSYDFYQQNYTKAAGITDTSTAKSAFWDVNKEFKDTYGASVAEWSEIADNYMNALNAGLSNEKAIAKAQSDALATRIEPWLDTQSSWYVNLSANLSADRMQQLQGQQLLIKQSEEGNRLLQDGIINSLTSDISPTLTAIDYNTGGASSLNGEYTAIMEQLVNNGMSSSEAYSQVQDIMKNDKNLYSALTSGDTNDILYATTKAKGGTTIDAYSNSTSYISSLAANSGSNLNASIIGSVLGVDAEGGWYTQGVLNKNIINGGQAQSRANELNNISSQSDIYSEYVSNIDNYQTTEQKYENFMTQEVSQIGELLKDFSKTALSDIASIVTSVAALVVALKGTSAIGGSSGGLLGSLFSSSGGLASSMSSATTSISSAAGTLAKVGGYAAGVVGAGMTLYDTISTTAETGDFGQGLLSGLTSTERDENTGESSTNYLKNAGKFAGIGAGIGTLIGGPVGTLIGAGIGGAAGLVAAGIGDAIQDDDESYTQVQYDSNGNIITDGSYATGLNSVSKDGIVKVHKGESIVNAKTAKALRKKGISATKRIDELSDDSNSVTVGTDTSNLESLLGTVISLLTESKDIQSNFGNLLSQVDPTAITGNKSNSKKSSIKLYKTT